MIERMAKIAITQRIFSFRASMIESNKEGILILGFSLTPKLYKGESQNQKKNLVANRDHNWSSDG